MTNLIKFTEKKMSDNYYTILSLEDIVKDDKKEFLSIQQKLIESELGIPHDVLGIIAKYSQKHFTYGRKVSPDFSRIDWRELSRNPAAIHLA